MAKEESVLVEKEYWGYCSFTGQPTTIYHHLVYGNGNKAKSEKYGLKLPVVTKPHYDMHHNETAMKLSRMLGQMAYEKEYFRKQCNGSNKDARESFRSEFGESFL